MRDASALIKTDRFALRMARESVTFVRITPNEEGTEPFSSPSYSQSLLSRVASANKSAAIAALVCGSSARDSAIFTHSRRWRFGAPASGIRQRASAEIFAIALVVERRKRKLWVTSDADAVVAATAAGAFTCDRSLSARSLPPSPRNRFPR